MSNPDANDDLPLDRFRSYLLLLARMQLDGRAQAKLDASDIVQQTLLEAHAKQHQFQGHDSALAAWLRQALANNLRDALRALRRGKRDIRREVSLEGSLENSSARMAGLLAADQSSPSKKVARSESLLQLATALEQLPSAQREAIVLHHLQGYPLIEAADRMGRTDAAVAGLLHRGLKRLRQIMSAESSP